MLDCVLKGVCTVVRSNMVRYYHDLYYFYRFTAEDKFGHIEGIFSYSSANTFKLDRWHALFMLRTHHPLNWNAEQFLDWMETAQKW